MVTPIGSSHAPGLFTLPLTPYNFVPLSSLLLSPMNHSAPLFTMWGTQQSVSTLFTIVGFPYNPLICGNGGFVLGVARLPSSAFSNAVSSPHMYLPTPVCRYICNEYPLPRILSPSNPDAYASSILFWIAIAASRYAHLKNTYE